jgi:hypothetical protein
VEQKSLVTHHLVVAATHRLLVAGSTTASADSRDRTAAKANRTSDISTYWHKAKDLSRLVVVRSLHDHENQRIY